jgi:hypothetical protein
VGEAQEKCTVYRTEKRHNPKNNSSYAWIVKSSALVNDRYLYRVGQNFGPFSSSSYLSITVLQTKHAAKGAMR